VTSDTHRPREVAGIDRAGVADPQTPNAVPAIESRRCWVMRTHKIIALLLLFVVSISRVASFAANAQVNEMSSRTSSGSLPGVGALNAIRSIRKNFAVLRGVNKQSSGRGGSCSSLSDSGFSDKGESTSGRPSGDSSNSLSDGVDNAIAVLETLRQTMSLSPEQESAISQIRSSYNSKRRDGPSQRPRRLTGPRDASGKTLRRLSDRARATFMKRELTQVFKEVKSSDCDAQNNTQDVLRTYGGESLEGVIGTEWTGLTRPLRHSNFTSNLSEEDVYSLKTEESKTDGEWKRNYQRRNTKIDPLSIPFELTASMEKFYTSEPYDELFCPPEWNNLTISARTELTGLLSVDNLSRWDFDVFSVTRLTAQRLIACDQSFDPIGCDCPLLLVGWAILCSPSAQHAMEASLGDNSDDSSAGNEKVHAEEDSLHGESRFAYNFCHTLNLKPEQVCNFLREIECRYSKEIDVPYHNNLHAADVTQTFHCLLQMVGKSTLEEIYDPLQLFSVLLSATFHDVGHPGYSNLFHENSRSKWAIQYNDQSILENMHSAVGHNLLMGSEKSPKWDIFSEWSASDITESRSLMMGAILGTDMSKHFRKTGDLAAMVEKTKLANREAQVTSEDSGGSSRNDDTPILSILRANHRCNGSSNNPKQESLVNGCAECAVFILKFLMHAADISNPTKKRDFAVRWAEAALEEFFAQGDLEKDLQLPISPLCDRRTVKKPDSQIGFLKFVIRPTFVLLGEIIPRVETDIIPIIDENIRYWTLEKNSLSVEKPDVEQHEEIGRVGARESIQEEHESDCSSGV